MAALTSQMPMFSAGRRLQSPQARPSKHGSPGCVCAHKAVHPKSSRDKRDEGAVPTSGEDASSPVSTWKDDRSGVTRRQVLSSTLATTALGTEYSGAAAQAVESAGGLERAMAQLTDRVSEFTLPNGLHFIVLKRDVAPIVSCHTYADVGAADEPDGATGLAHLLEHMAFKGTQQIGAVDYSKEVAFLNAEDEEFYAAREALALGNMRAADGHFAQLSKIQAEAAELQVPNAFGALYRRQGGVGLNASTNQDATNYYISLPSNKLELWMAMESERWRAPVFRQLYSEKEERKLVVDNAPLGRFSVRFSAASTMASATFSRARAWRPSRPQVPVRIAA
ncbi:mitochondrial thiamine pyrophosphate transporter [Cymbomonas tetramitiformis]|uniref:Mitochondrial thiamine pyrophosphate transporter n=1 Tax=Cymbomonas tetramitiformis TaxID=36881 RepID=A0AAE0BXZ7_9CHLO|nr:mitochondrial thiamine pyrophosphate transporter [Cymbomonas tetramitiformis]